MLAGCLYLVQDFLEQRTRLPRCDQGASAGDVRAMWSQHPPSTVRAGEDPAAPGKTPVAPMPCAYSLREMSVHGPIPRRLIPR